MKYLFFISCIFTIGSACNQSPQKHYNPQAGRNDRAVAGRAPANDSVQAASRNYADSFDVQYINPGRTKVSELVAFAETLIGVPYLYGSVNPEKGFDCSGFITYVFNHFNIAVPRSSEGFTSVEREIPLRQARRGDIILFTGTDSTKRIVGHMGIVTSLSDKGHEFIHSTSGKAYGVTITPLNSYYQGRFVKAIRIFE